ncbi:hypothetical protein LYSHEL_22140 [Lysobacter helvus]|uniref:Cupin type-2 domain-containing protein n=3 Tax=Lysobacterales TaxID=135614 RepID=A0ABM7Q722_9GAMM|nr:hypothetical protein LYSCAS_22150 [Lysobacter caseinilyticus]BCT96343.1 hypothetical protein LYSHEL_22140 [Lysobacter helvus]
MSMFDIFAEQTRITGSYTNKVLANINQECLRLAVFEGEYRWHHHPDSDELFLVVTGSLQIDFANGAQVTLTQWECLVVPRGTTHRTRALGRTVNLTFERLGAQTVFSEGPPNTTPPCLES